MGDSAETPRFQFFHGVLSFGKKPFYLWFKFTLSFGKNIPFNWWQIYRDSSGLQRNFILVLSCIWWQIYRDSSGLQRNFILVLSCIWWQNYRDSSGPQRDFIFSFVLYFWWQIVGTQWTTAELHFLVLFCHLGKMDIERFENNF